MGQSSGRGCLQRGSADPFGKSGRQHRKQISLQKTDFIRNLIQEIEIVAFELQGDTPPAHVPMTAVPKINENLRSKILAFSAGAQTFLEKRRKNTSHDILGLREWHLNQV